MIVDKLENAERYFGIHPSFASAFRFLREHANGLPDGRHEIDGKRLYAISATSTGRGRTEARLEYHRRYIDIQFSVTGTDCIGWRPTSDCTEVEQSFDPEQDCGLLADEPLFWVPVPPGVFTVFFPEDAHAPLAGDGEVQKIVVKIMEEV